MTEDLIQQYLNEQDWYDPPKDNETFMVTYGKMFDLYQHLALELLKLKKRNR